MPCWIQEERSYNTKELRDGVNLCRQKPVSQFEGQSGELLGAGQRKCQIKTACTHVPKPFILQFDFPKLSF